MPYFLRSLARASRVSSPSSFSALRSSSVVLDQRARDAEAHRAGLTRHAAAGDRREDVELLGGLGEDERPANLDAQRFGGEEGVERARG